MKIVITGGAGYTGVMLAESVLEAGHDVTVVDNFLYGYESILRLVPHKKFNIVKTDMRNQDMSYLDDADVIYHLAGISGYPACEANPNSAWLINVEATRQMTEHLSKNQMVIYASTTSFYGSTGAISDETTTVEPVSLYAVTKYEGEKIIMERDNSIALRWATVFGTSPRMRAGLLVNDFCEKSVTENCIVLYDPDSKRSFMHVRDLVRGYMFALENADAMQGQVFNMGSDRMNYTKREIAQVIQEINPCDVVLSKIGDKDIRDFQVSYAKAKGLGYDCEVGLKEGVEELIKLYRFYTPHSFIKPI
ncbi:MAG: SDR family oxidoreductase [Alphaproteobacteria bacterium]|nr:SDR family oxidoreductase [Alphaproteobacteria bacterium]